MGNVRPCTSTRHAVQLPADTCGPQFVHHIGAERIHPKLGQPPRLRYVVHRPDNDASADCMKRFDQWPVDHLPMWPVVSRIRRLQRMDGIDQIRVGQNAHRGRC